jgi:hypothetical protein
MNLRDLVVDPRAEEELRWRFHWGDGEMSEPSNFEGIRARIECGGRTGGKPITDIPERRLAASGKARRIDKALKAVGKLNSDLERVLRACYGPDATPLAGFGDASGAAPLTVAARHEWAVYRASLRSPGPNTPSHIGDWLFRLCYRAERDGSRASDRILVAQIRAQAEALRISATRAYSAARRSAR